MPSRRSPVPPAAVVRVAVMAVLAVAVAACASEPIPAGPLVTERAGTTAPTTQVPATGSVPVTTGAPDAVLPEGFDRVAATVTKADGTVCELCLWLAADGEQRARGLMFVTDLGPADGMAFRYDEPRTGNFWMKNTLLPLSIAFFDRDGRYLDAFDMEPCTADPCPTYRTPNDFLIAIETTQGDLAELGIEPGSTLSLSDLPCP